MEDIVGRTANMNCGNHLNEFQMTSNIGVKISMIIWFQEFVDQFSLWFWGAPQMIHLWIRNCRFLVDPVPREKIDSKMRKHAKDSCSWGKTPGKPGRFWWMEISRGSSYILNTFGTRNLLVSSVISVEILAKRTSSCECCSSLRRVSSFHRLTQGSCNHSLRTSAKPFEWANSSGRGSDDGSSNESLHKKEIVYLCVWFTSSEFYIWFHMYIINYNHILCDLYHDS